MRAISRLMRGRHDENRASRRKASALGFVETLEGRPLLSVLYPTMGSPAQGGLGGQMEVANHGGGALAPAQSQNHGDIHNQGPVRKDPQFYEFYVGPKRQDLNVVSAQVQLKPGQGLVFKGTMQGKIDKTPATSADDSVYVFGVNRGSPKAVAPFFNRPGVVFDSVVAVSVSHDTGITATVTDLTTGTSTKLDPRSVKIEGRDVQVTVNPALLPTPAGGKPLSQYTFNLWPRSSLANPAPTAAQPHASFVASFIPENGMAPIQVPRGHGR
jgi:hypothetical protein